MHTFDRQTNRRTDKRTDSFLTAIPRLHSTQRGKNVDLINDLVPSKEEKP